MKINNKIAIIMIAIVFTLSGVIVGSYPVKVMAKASKPAKVKVFSAKCKVNSNTIVLKWRKVKKAKRYHVYAATSKKFEKIKTTKKTKFIYKGSYGKTYRFKVRGVNGKTKGAFSKIIEVKVKKPKSNQISKPNTNNAQSNSSPNKENISFNKEDISFFATSSSVYVEAPIGYKVVVEKGPERIERVITKAGPLTIYATKARYDFDLHCSLYDLNNNKVAEDSYYYFSDEDDRKVVDDTVAKIKKQFNITDKSKDVEKAKAVAEWLCENVEYDLDYRLGAIITTLKKGKAVCAGYANTFDYLLYVKFGVETDVVDTKDSHIHRWNLVKIDGEWYAADITWMDKSSIDYRWFLISSAYSEKIDSAEKEHTYPDISNLPTDTRFDEFQEKLYWSTDEWKNHI